MATKKKARRVNQPAEPQAETQKPDPVRVRALQRGYAGELFRNPGEVFVMDTKIMEPVRETKDLPEKIRTATLEKYDTMEHIETSQGEFLLPSWVELVEEGDAVEAGAETPSGHPKIASSNVI